MRRRDIDVIVIDNDDNDEYFSRDNDPTRGYGRLLVKKKFRRIYIQKSFS